MKNLYSLFIFAAIAASFPAVASKNDELKAACKDNPTHEICQAREAKAAKTKAKREAKVDAAILRVKENR